MRKRLSWWGTIKLFLLLLTFALFIYIVTSAPVTLMMFNKLFLLVGMNILAAVLELLKVVKDEPQVICFMIIPILRIKIFNPWKRTTRQ